MVPRPYRKNDGSVRVLPATGYGVRGYGYGVGKSDPRVTRSKPYTKMDHFIISLMPLFKNITIYGLTHSPLVHSSF